MPHIVICGLSGCTLFFSHYPINGKIFEKKTVTEHKMCVLIFCKTRIKLYNTLALPVLLYDSETWIIKARDSRRITAAEMKYMRRTAGYAWTDYKTNDTNCKRFKNNTSFGQITGTQEKLDTTCK
jgi:hypothetical protein